MDSLSFTADWLKTPISALSQRDLCAIAWAFGIENGVTHGRNLRLLPDGRIGGYLHPNEKFWDLQPDHLALRNQAGITTTKFTECQVHRNGRLKLTGGGHVLEEITPPYRLESDPGKFKLQKNFSGPRRRNLVIIGANESSLHPQWQQNLSEADRSWDLCVSFYGAAAHYNPCAAEYTSLQTGVRKWLAIHAAMHESSPFWDYERIFILDDDIRTTWRDINHFLEICRDYNLALAQPSLLPGCHITHPITMQQPGSLLRFTTFVEAMAPCFTRDALRDCIPTAQGGYYGFGIDHLWPKILGLPRNRIAIVDEIAIEHTRQFASTYPLDIAKAEERHLFAQYGMGPPLGYRETGRLLR
jgi:hypothetical protein